MHSFPDANERGGHFFLTSMSLATNFFDRNTGVAKNECGQDHGTDCTHKMTESLRNFTNKDKYESVNDEG